MRPEPPAKKLKEARTPKAKRNRQLIEENFFVGQQVQIVHRAANGFETRGPATIIDINFTIKEWGMPHGLIYVRVPVLGDHIYELDYSTGSWRWRRAVNLDRTAREAGRG